MPGAAAARSSSPPTRKVKRPGAAWRRASAFSVPRRAARLACLGWHPENVNYSGRLFSEYIARTRLLAWLKRPNHTS